MRTHSRFGLGLAMVTALMLVVTSACSDGGGKNIIGPPDTTKIKPVPKMVELGVIMKDGSAVPSDVTLTLTDRNYSKVIPMVDGKFAINADSLAPFSDDMVELYFSGADHRYPSLKRVHVDSLKQNKVKGAVLVNDEKCLSGPEYVGTYEGQCVQISLPLGFDSVTVDNGSTYSYYRRGSRLTLGTLPIKVAISPELLGDSANIWQGLHEVEKFVGIKRMYAPAPYGEVVDSSLIMPGYYLITLHGLLIQVEVRPCGDYY